MKKVFKIVSLLLLFSLLLSCERADLFKYMTGQLPFPFITIDYTGSKMVQEGAATDSYTIVLNKQPEFDVTVSILPDEELLVNNSTELDLIFTVDNWNIPQSILIEAVDDTDAEGDHFGIIQHSCTSIDSVFNSDNISDLNIIIIDNEIGVSIVQSGGSTTITEDGTIFNYSIELLSAPSADVNVTVIPGVGGGPQISVNNSRTPIVITFSNINWNVAQTVTVTAIDDNIVEGVHPTVITHSVTSNDSNYDEIFVDSIYVAIIDNDFTAPGVTINETGGSTNITENGTNDIYTLVLDSQPTSDVYLTITPDSNVQIDGYPIPVVYTFSPADWNIPVDITVDAQDDQIAEGTHNAIITHTTSSNDSSYDNIAIQNLNVQIIDNDNPGVIITQTGGSTDVAEYGGEDSISIRLNSIPTSDVNISLTSPSQVLIDGSDILSTTFTPTNWNVTQNFPISAVDDSVGEYTHTGSIIVSVASGPGNFVTLGTVGNIIVNIRDDDALFVAVGDNGVIICSTDGETWYDTSNGSNARTGIAYGNGRFVAVGPLGGIWYSTDASNGSWTDSSFLGSSVVLNDVCYGNNRFLAVGGMAPEGRAYWSPDAAAGSWETNNVISGSSYQILNAVVYGNGEFVAVGGGGQLHDSTSGDIGTWNSSSLVSAQFMGVAFGNAQYVFAPNEAFLYSGININSFSMQNFGILSERYTDVVYGNGYFIAVGTSGQIWVFSSDGIGGLVYENDMTFGNNLNSIIFGNGRFVAVGDNATVWYSDDGLTWNQPLSIPVSVNLQGITFRPDN